MAPDTFTAIIVDDLPYAIETLSAKLKYLFSSISVIGKFTFWENALEGLNKLEPDIVFMDISMPGKSGMDILRMVPTLQAEIIFITAHKDYARSAFDFAASGYILKPIDDLELTIAVEKAMERTKHKRLAKQHVDHQQLPLVGVPNNKGIDYININDIIYIETSNKSTSIITRHTELQSSYNIGKFKDILNDNIFFQVHRSYLINLYCVKRYETDGVVVMSNDAKIPIAKNMLENFLEVFSRISKTPESGPGDE